MQVTAHAERYGRWWIVTIPDVAGGLHTQARRLDQVAAMAADAVATVMETDVDNIEVAVVPELPSGVASVVDEAQAASAAVADAQAHASAAMRAAVAALTQDEALTTRDAARILGVSHQRVAQLTH